MNFSELNKENFLLFAIKYYDNPTASTQEEFEEDLKRFKYLKRLFNKYKENGELKDRLVLNHLIVLYNLFGNEGTTRMLFFKLGKYLDILKPFLVLLSRLPEKVEGLGIEGKTLYTSDITDDSYVVDVLRSI